MQKNQSDSLSPEKKSAFVLILLFGVVSLLGDIIYEGARSVNGPFLNILGAGAATVGLIVGAAELSGYAVRLVSGYFSDRFRSYWFYTIAGYAMLAAVPLLAFADSWQIAAAFIVIERIGKGLRSPARDTLVSHATKKVGTGIGFGISEFIDQIGAVAGPLVFTFFLFFTQGRSAADYQQGYSLYWIPYILLISVLYITFTKYRSPQDFEKDSGKAESSGLTKTFWIYSLFTFTATAGFINFAIIGFHLKAEGILSDEQIPFLYAAAMTADALFGLAAGKIYDNLKIKHAGESGGLRILLWIPLLSAALLPLVFHGGTAFLYTAVVLWGMVMGLHETVMKAAIADITPAGKRGTAYGIFNVIYGGAMFAGTAGAGFLYDYSVSLMIAVLASVQIVSLIVYAFLRIEIRRNS